MLLQLAEAAMQDLVPRELPGPTGESNELRLHARGVFLCLAGAESAHAHSLAATLAAALLAGNAVALHASSAAALAQAEPLLRVLRQAGLPEGVLQLVGGSRDAWLAAEGIAGVCLGQPCGPASLLALQRSLASRAGAILPLIAAEEALLPPQLYRFAAEQTLTINTAAAGGNAALLAGRG
jgi:RHH-type proline utilization regulon transcriptional repressor/proline dehydrogenase/delta 1-pyrroline-5-carboxylate dehydrogenase